MRNIIKNFFNGLAFGITEIIPGVSGGTIAIILGFYFSLIEAINHFTEDLRKNLKFLIPVALGTITGIVFFSSVINYLLANFSFPTMLFFIGLITGIIPHIFNKVKEKGKSLKPIEVVLIIIPFTFLLIISSFKNASITDPHEVVSSMNALSVVFIFFSGILAAMALVIPGISGSFVLLLLGIYPLAIYSVSSIRFFLADISNTALLLDICKVLIPLAIGMIIGGLCMVRLIEKLLKNYSEIVYSVILGLLSGSVIVLFREPMVYKSGVSSGFIAAGVITFALGCVASFWLGRKKI